jgi:hypothetical protein
MKSENLFTTTGTCGHHLVTSEPFRKGELILDFNAARPTRRPTYQTIQVNHDEHVLEEGILSFMNHSCHPNVFINTELRRCFALQDIHPGEELTFFYPSTEWEMARPFQCLCGHPQCIKTVSGAVGLSETTLARYHVNPHIRTMKCFV